MSGSDALLGSLNRVAYTSFLNPDKVAIYSTTTDSSGVGSNGRLTAAAPSNPTSVQTTIASIPNPYGRKCLMTLSWSLDGLNYYSMNTPKFYYNPSYNSYFWQALAYGGCSDSTIYFAVASQYTSSQVVYFQFALDSPT